MQVDKITKKQFIQILKNPARAELRRTMILLKSIVGEKTVHSKFYGNVDVAEINVYLDKDSATLDLDKQIVPVLKNLRHWILHGWGTDINQIYFILVKE